MVINTKIPLMDKGAGNTRSLLPWARHEAVYLHGIEIQNALVKAEKVAQSTKYVAAVHSFVCKTRNSGA